MAKHYYISFNSTDFTEIFPSNEPVGTKNQIEGTRVWRESVDEIRLTETSNSSVYTTLHSYFIDKTKFDTEIEIEIYTGTLASGVLYWKGLFSISDTVDNFENTVAVLNPLRINDNYRTILEQSDVQHELDYGTLILEDKRIGYAEALTIGSTWTNGSIGTAFSTFTASGGTITSAIAPAGVGYEAYLPISESVATGDIVVIDVSAFSSNASPTFDIMYGAGNSMSSEGARSISARQMGFTMTSNNASPRIWFQASPGTSSLTFTTRKILAANDMTQSGEVLLTFLEAFITGGSFMDLGAYSGDVVSTFFNNDALPTGAPSSITTIMAGAPSGNYVTGSAYNELGNTLMGLLIEWFSVTDKPSFKLSFNDIMSQLRDMFQVYWFIDADDKFRVEHEMYFVSQVADSTPIVLSDQSQVDAQKMVYNKDRIASTETFAWAQSSNQDFMGKNIIYNNFETTNTSREYSLSYVTTDLKYVVDNIDDASNSGLGIYNCNRLTGMTADDIYEIKIVTGELSGSGISNGAFSWANLHEAYWSWSRMAEDATVNAGAVTMDSSVRFLEQAGINFFYSTAIDPFTLIQSSLTGAAPIEISRNLDTDYVSINISYDPYKL